MSESFYAADQLAHLQESYYSVNPGYERDCWRNISFGFGKTTLYRHLARVPL